MEIGERLEFCRKCMNKETNSIGSYACVLTHDKPDFEEACPHFTRDEREPDKALHSSYFLGFSEIKEYTDPDVYEKLRMEQSMVNAIVFGLVASVIGAILWAVITVATGYQIGYMALGIGALVGFTIRYMGKGFEQTYAILGAGISLFGCLLGNLLSVVALASRELNVGFFQIFGSLNFYTVVQVMIQTFQFMDIVFYGIAIYEGFRFATLKFTERSLWEHTLKYKK